MFGAYGEATADVHDLIAAAAEAQARLQWRQAGARSHKEFRAYAILNIRRRVGLAAVKEMAQHTIARMPLFNVPRQAVEDAMANRRRQWNGQGATTLRNWSRTSKFEVRSSNHVDFYCYQHSAGTNYDGVGSCFSTSLRLICDRS